MRKLLLFALAFLTSASVTRAQSKIDTKWHCPKATTTHKLDVGDVADHSLSIAQGACEAASSEGDLKEKTGAFTEFHDGWKSSFNFHGYFNATTDNGDKINYKYEGSASNDMTKPVSNKWKIVGGTGDHEGIKGSGTCAGKAGEEAYDWECTGTYSMGMSK